MSSYYSPGKNQIADQEFDMKNKSEIFLNACYQWVSDCLCMEEIIIESFSILKDKIHFKDVLDILVLSSTDNSYVLIDRLLKRAYHVLENTIKTYNIIENSKDKNKIEKIKILIEVLSSYYNNSCIIQKEHEYEIEAIEGLCNILTHEEMFSIFIKKQCNIN